MKKAVSTIDLVPAVTEKLGIIAISVKDKDGIEKIAKAPCDVEVTAGVTYTLLVWNVRAIVCPMCKDKTKEEQAVCRLCEGVLAILSFSYVLKPKKLMRKAWEKIEKGKNG